MEAYKLLGADVIDFRFKVIKKPSQKDGFYTYSVSPSGDVRCSEDKSGIELINEAKVIGYLGESPEGDEDLEDRDKVFEIELKFRCIYSIPKDEKSENILLEKLWFFEPHARLFSKQVIQGFLANTEYNNVSIPL